MTEALKIVRPDSEEGSTEYQAPIAPALMTSAELATELQISERTIRRLEITGKIGPRPMNIGRAVRYRRDEVEKWIEAGCPARDRWGGRRLRKH